MNLPYFWKGMSFTARAGWLLAAGRARDYSEACSMLAKMKRPKRVIQKPSPPQNIRLPYADS